MVEGLLSQASLDRPELVEYVLALMQHNLHEGWIAALEAMKNRPDAMGALRGMPRPTLVVAGELDRVTPLSESTLISRLVAEGELVVVKDSSHLPNLENPTDFNGVLRQFLSERGPKPEADAEAAD
jgi:pimeloyl-ACP methyl ester carboxylesterase